MSAFHAALPYIQHRGRIVFLHPFHVDNTSDIQNYNRTRECSAHFFKHLLLPIGEKIAALFRAGIPILSCRTSYDHYGRIGPGRSFSDQFICKRHLFLAPRFLSPAVSDIKGVFYQPFPVSLFQPLIQNQIFFF